MKNNGKENQKNIKWIKVELNKNWGKKRHIANINIQNLKYRENKNETVW